MLCVSRAPGSSRHIPAHPRLNPGSTPAQPRPNPGSTPAQPRPTHISNSLVPLLEAVKRRQGREIVTWGPPGGFLEALKPMNVSRIVAWGASWTSKSSQSTSKEPLGSLLRAPRELLGGFLGASWGSPGRLLVLQMLPELQNLMSGAMSMQI